MKTVIPDVDRDGAVTVLVCEAQGEEAAGNPEGARKKYEQAGKVLEAKARAERDYRYRAFFLLAAASQYFRGRSFERCVKVCRRIDVRTLPEEYRGAFREMFRATKSSVSEKSA